VAPSGRPKNKVVAGSVSSTTEANGTLDVKPLETWLWDAACQIRGPLDAPKFKDYILPLIFLKRLSDVFDDEVQRVADEVGDLNTAKEIIDEDHALVRFYLPAESTFATDLLAQPTPFQREVIVHQLLHLKVPNHGPLFRALLSAHLGSTDMASTKPTGEEQARGQLH
jgi:hypothetical protein